MKTEMPVRMNTMNPVTLCSLKQNHWVSTKPSAAFTPVLLLLRVLKPDREPEITFLWPPFQGRRAMTSHQHLASPLILTKPLQTPAQFCYALVFVDQQTLLLGEEEPVYMLNTGNH